MFAGCHYRLLEIFILTLRNLKAFSRVFYPAISFAACLLLLASTSCTLFEERIDRRAGGPNVPADTVIEMPPESADDVDVCHGSAGRRTG